MLRQYLVWGCLVSCFATSVWAQPKPPAAQGNSVVSHDQVLADSFRTLVEAYNQKKPEQLVTFFTDDAVLIDAEGNVTKGKPAITERFTASLSQPETYQLAVGLDQVRPITADVMQVTGNAKFTRANEPELVQPFVVLLVKKGTWQIAEIRDLPAPEMTPPPPSAGLAELQWMVGEWVDENPAGKTTSSVVWGDNRAFLIRSYKIDIAERPVTGGVMIIGYDANTNQIRSWAFDGTGGRAEGAWTRTGDQQWIIKTHGVTGDGQATSATQYVNVVSPDVVKTGSFDQIVGDAIATDLVEILMVRKPPAPSADAGLNTTPAKPAR